MKVQYECKPANGGKSFTRCMLLDKFLPSAVVTASHLFRRANSDIVKDVLGFDDIDDWKNGLLLFSPIEKAFDEFRLGFVYDNSDDTYRLRLFDTTAEFRETSIIEYIPEVLREKLDLSSTAPDGILRFTSYPDTELDLRTTFADLEGMPIAFKNLNRPFRRCLNLQARIAFIQATEVQGAVDVPDFEDFWSEGMREDDLLQRYFNSMASS